MNAGLSAWPNLPLLGPDEPPPPPPPDEAHRLSQVPWPRRVLETATAFLPPMLMAVLALGTWWLVKSTPSFDNDRAPAPLRHEPDYAMSEFMVQRFSARGVMRVQIEGEAMRHYPDTETTEIDNPRVRAIGDDGRVTLATARQAIANHDASEVQLIGTAHVVREASASAAAIEFRGEFLHCFQNTERVRSHLPVTVTQEDSEIHADSMAYDNLAHVLDLQGRLRAVFVPLAPGKKPL